MLSRSRTYARVEPDKDASLVLIFCEGSKTEPAYFRYFNELNSQIRIEAVPADDQGNNSPEGLLESAKLATLKTADNPSPRYEIGEEDEVWFAIDTDQWPAKNIQTLRDEAARQGWRVVQSNPCFEVWLYYHFVSDSPSFAGHENSVNWKAKLPEFISGGFQFNKHPIYIERAIEQARSNFINIGTASSTEVFSLGERIFLSVKKEIDEGLLKNADI